MKQKPRFYDFTVAKLNAVNCAELRGYIKSYGDKVKKLEEILPCKFSISIELLSCGPSGINKFINRITNKYPDVTFSPVVRHRRKNNG